MKETDFCRRGPHNRAEPDWKTFEATLAPHLPSQDEGELARAIAYLLAHPPQVQVFQDGKAAFHSAPLRGAADGARVCEALRRIRNNLFHGGKHTDHSPEERDAKLLRCGLLVLEAAADLDAHLRSVYRGEY
jgi:hypothetical protein